MSKSIEPAATNQLDQLPPLPPFKEGLSAYMRAWYLRRKAKGVCARCNRPRKKNERIFCRMCKAKNKVQRELRENARKTSGLCPMCGKKSEKAFRCNGCLEIYRKKYRKALAENPDQFAVNSANKRARERRRPGRITVAIWQAIKKAQNHKCLCCGRKEPKIKLGIDHVIPFSARGSNRPSNIQGLCLACNLKKGTEVTDYRLGKSL
jgi:5-methylcytosine-specific restriction endonuclease McrA